MVRLWLAHSLIRIRRDMAEAQAISPTVPRIFQVPTGLFRPLFRLVAVQSDKMPQKHAKSSTEATCQTIGE